MISLYIATDITFYSLILITANPRWRYGQQSFTPNPTSLKITYFQNLQLSKYNQDGYDIRQKLQEDGQLFLIRVSLRRGRCVGEH